MYGFILMGLAHFGHPPHLLSFPGFVIREFCFYILTFRFGRGSRRHGYGFANLSCGIPSFMFLVMGTSLCMRSIVEKLKR